MPYSSPSDYTEVIRSLGSDERFPDELVRRLERLPGFRKRGCREYVVLDLDRAIEALDEFDPNEQFFEIVDLRNAGIDRCFELALRAPYRFIASPARGVIGA